MQWVENNPTNICIFPTIFIPSLPHGTTLTAFADVDTDVAGCQMGWFLPTLKNGLILCAEMCDIVKHTSLQHRGTGTILYLPATSCSC